jgi:hypothetical protein
VYLIENNRHAMVKIGVTNVGSARLARFLSSGWAVIGLWRADSGRPALAAEASVLSRWRSDGALLEVPPDDYRNSGISEIAAAADVDISAVSTMVEAVLGHGCALPFEDFAAMAVDRYPSACRNGHSYDDAENRGVGRDGLVRCKECSRIAARKARNRRPKAGTAVSLDLRRGTALS